VRQLGTGSERAAIPMTILNLAQGLGLKVVAEGVENEDQFATLSAHNCDFAQGELVGTPLVATDAIVNYLDSRLLMCRNSDAFFL
jgi:EAL domain-containing protein (putative c-di-GMP-specific phosphodiesterase class I)